MMMMIIITLYGISEAVFIYPPLEVRPHYYHTDPGSNTTLGSSTSSDPVWGPWEPVHVYRQRLGLPSLPTRRTSSSSTPTIRHIDPELCRYLTVEQCQREDEIAAQGLPQRRRLYEHLQRRRRRNAQNSAGGHRRHLNNPLGTFTALVVLVQFPEHPSTLRLPPKQHFENLCQTGSLSIQKYFELQSYNQYHVQCHVTDWIVTNHTQADYSAGVSNLQGSELSAAFFEPVLDVLDGNGTDWSLFDADGDFLLDAVLVIHSGYAAEQGDGSACGAGPITDRIHSQGHPSSDINFSWRSLPRLIQTSSSPNATKTYAMVQYHLSGYALASAWDKVCTADFCKMGIMTHEWIHTFGPPDLYDLNTGRIGGLGSFDIMANPYGANGDATYPGSLSPYNKIICRWVTPQLLTQDGNYTLRASNRYPDVYMIQHNFPVGEYLLIENRQTRDFDVNLYGNGGLLIYHVDTNKELQEDAGWPGQMGWPSNNFHYRVALLQADGNYDLERGNNNGDAGDWWTPGMTLRPGTGENYPNTDSYQGGQIVATGITITNISPSGMTMSFEVRGLSITTAAPSESLQAVVDTPSPSSSWWSSPENGAPTVLHGPTASPLCQVSKPSSSSSSSLADPLCLEEPAAVENSASSSYQASWSIMTSLGILILTAISCR